MFRNERDMAVSFNSLCSALCKTDSSCLAYAAMSDHHHGCYSTKHPGELIRIYRESYTKQFNHRYYRVGPLGETGVYMQEISGLQHMIAAISYTLKNPPHHGVTSSPFEYPYSSANAYFRKELGKNRNGEIYLTQDQIKAVLPRRASFNPAWKMGVDGVFLPETVVDVETVENGMAPFSLESIEQPMLARVSVAEMLRNEKARYVTAPISDLELCKVIDEIYVPRYERKSVYHLKRLEITAIANELYKEYRANTNQIKRCLVMTR